MPRETTNKVAELSNEFAWSFSRQRCFDECLRRYYWQYYGSWGGWNESAPEQARKAYRLKNLDHLPALVGKIVHEVIGRSLRVCRRPCNVPIDQLRLESHRTLDRALGESNLIEGYYGNPLSPAKIRSEHQRIDRILEYFSNSNYAKRLYVIGKERIVADIQKFADKTIVFEGVKLFGNPDVILFSEDERVHIIDWKTGLANPRDALQLAVYALYTTEKYKVNWQSITGHAVYLQGTPPPQKFERLQDKRNEVAELIDRFVNDAANLLLDRRQNIPKPIELFPMTENLMRCAHCNFAELCERQTAYSSPRL